MAEAAQSTHSAPNASAAPPGQTLALSMLNKASVKTGSRCSGLVDTRRKYRADYDAGEELLVDASETHERRRARDGIKYTKAEFIDFWGEKRGQVMWEDAGCMHERRRHLDGVIYTRAELNALLGNFLGFMSWKEAGERSLTPEPSEQPSEAIERQPSQQLPIASDHSDPFPFLLPSEAIPNFRHCMCPNCCQLRDESVAASTALATVETVS